MTQKHVSLQIYLLIEFKLAVRCQTLIEFLPAIDSQMRLKLTKSLENFQTDFLIIILQEEIGTSSNY